MANCQQVFIDNDEHIIKATEQHMSHTDIVIQFRLVRPFADKQALTVYFVYKKIVVLNHSAKVIRK